MICLVKLLQKKWSESRGGEMPTGKKKSSFVDFLTSFILWRFLAKAFFDERAILWRFLTKGPYCGVFDERAILLCFLRKIKST